MKLFTIVIGVFVIAGFNHVLAQRYHSRAEAPTQLSVLSFGQRETSSVYLIWLGNENIASYVIKIYRRGSNVVYRRIPNLLLNFKNVTGLDSGMSYYATVSAVYINEAGEEVISPESNQASFETDEVCSNGQVYLTCDAHCVNTCEDPIPVCSRECRRGCGCPSETPIWHNERCVTLSQCPSGSSVVPVKPQELQAFTDRRNSTYLVWVPVANALKYTIKVRIEQTGELVHEQESRVPIVQIFDLVPGISYEFSVQITLERPQTTLSSSRLPSPRPIFTRNVTENSFFVRWYPQSKASNYTLVLYDQNQTTILATKVNIGGTSIMVNNLAPGSTYYYAVASASASGKLGPFSRLREVITRGRPMNTGNLYVSTIVYTPSAVSTTAMPATTTPRHTRCRQYYESVRNFYNQYPGVDGPEYPVCDSEGMYVTRKCNSATPPRECYCIDRLNGRKMIGSNFGGGNSNFELDCNQFGNLEVASLGMEARNLSSTSLEVRWNEIESVRGYVLYVDNKIRDGRTIAIEGSSRTSYQLDNLRSGHTIDIGVYAVDMQGRASPMSQMEVSTSLLDIPQDVVVRELSSSSFRLSWQYSPNSDGANINIISRDTSAVIRNFKVSGTSVIITDLEPLRYTVEIRHIRCDAVCSNPRSSVLYRSDPASVEINLQCRQPVIDVLFAFDASSESGLNLQKEIAQEIVRRLPPIDHATRTRVAAIKYDQRATTLFSYNRFNDASMILNQIRSVRAADTSSNPAFMLNFVRTRFFNPLRTAAFKPRRNSVTVAIVFSGGATSSAPIIQHASSLLQAQTNVVSIGTSPNANRHVLSLIASSSSLKYVASASDNISSIVSRITQQFCQL